MAERAIIEEPFPYRRYENCSPLELTCVSCNHKFICPAIHSYVISSLGGRYENTEFWRFLKCPNPSCVNYFKSKHIAQQVSEQAKSFVNQYNEKRVKCLSCKYIGTDDTLKSHTPPPPVNHPDPELVPFNCPMCDGKYGLKMYSKRKLQCQSCDYVEKFRLHTSPTPPDPEIVSFDCPDCHGKLIRQYTKEQLEKQLTFFQFLLDTHKEFENPSTFYDIDKIEPELARLRHAVRPARAAIDKLHANLAYSDVPDEPITRH